MARCLLRQYDPRWMACVWSLVFLTQGAMPRVGAAVPPAQLEFARDVRPILADACFVCHGMDTSKRQADLRLDTEAGLAAQVGDGPLVVPGNAAASVLYQRMISHDSAIQMPPAGAKQRPTLEQVATLGRWIEEGAVWQPHWSLVPPRRPPLPAVHGAEWGVNSIDSFVLARLEIEGMKPSPAADRAALARRVALDLTGLPIALEDLDAHLADESPLAYERLVDRLLASPQYGERMAVPWLDAARYADTDGYQDDEPRSMWRWRDWVIDVHNDGLPYDHFTRNQIAGDLVPNGFPEQVLATGFFRNNRTNGEGGSIEAEFHNEYIVDRVVTFGAVWMGVTLECARCHDHKYDAISQRDFYQLYALFNQIPEKGVYRHNSPPTIHVAPRSTQRLLDHIDRQLQQWEAEDPRREALAARREQLTKDIPDTMVLQDGPPRETFLLVRGQYDKPGEPLEAGVPTALAPWPREAPNNRLGLAEWLLDSNHPLTARVAVNRLWQLHFGQGLVDTMEDFGAQGQQPSHPELLDWLASEYRRSGWDTKRLQRLMVMSQTYRQASRVSPERLERDPTNRWLGRGARFRLAGEVLRDQALALSGLLVFKMGGPPVRPYQPDGLWQELAEGSSGAYSDGYQHDTRDGIYRRSLYSFWRRTIPPPSMSMFDSPDREVCALRRPVTNTPMQALNLMNDVTVIEAARHLARRMMSEGGESLTDRIRWGFRLATARWPTELELQALTAGWQRYRTHLQSTPADAEKLIHVGQSTPDSPLPVVEWGAYTVLANTILNLDETVTRE